MTIGTKERPLRVAIIGSGPAGFYCADALLGQTATEVEVDMFDRLPTPYGLVRGGVAPDHQKIKSVIAIYERAAQHENFRFLGNVMLGRDVQVADLVAHYDQIVYAVGNEADRRLGIPGEYLIGVTPATVFVGWYNAHPDYRDATFDFSAKSVAVVGNGNVAVDVARILAQDAEELAATDIASHALSALERSQVRQIHLLGRRGPVQAAFTPAELRELGHLEEADAVVDPREIDLDEGSLAELEASGKNSAAQKNVALLREYATRGKGDKPRKLHFHFLVSPVEFIGDDDGRVRAVRLEKNILVPGSSGGLQAKGTGEFFEIPVQMVLVSIGYRGRPIPGVPFDERKGIIPNTDGCVTDPATGEVVPNQYVAGWAKSGPQGLIGSHKQASGAVAKLVLEDLRDGRVPERDLPDREAIYRLLDERQIDFVTFHDWKILDRVEVNRGQRRGAPRVKFSAIEDMLVIMGKRDHPDWR